MKRTLQPTWAMIPAAVVLWAFSTLAAMPATADYGFFRTVDGYAALIQGDTGASVEVEANYPVLVGDRVEISERGRVEAVLADGSYLRIDGGTELAFEEQRSESGGALTSILRLDRGEIQLVLPHDDKSGEPLRIDTVNATIYVEQRGSYRIYSDGKGWTEVVVREGLAEVLTERGTSVVRAGEQSTVNGTRWPRVTLRAAGGLDDLELWGRDLLASARGTTSPYVDSGLGYASAPLARHGSWIHVGGRYAWQPAVEVGWRPYYYGRWGYTPAGLTWISPEPWGWVTYHYGTWDLAFGVGWVWYPGRVYTPAAVYWYWGPSHVAWVPAGYYHSYYRPHHYRSGFGFHFGVHGWAGGSISHWSHWTFCATGSFGRRGGYRNYSTGAEITRSGRMSVVPRGVIATDTRAITPDRWHKPAEVMGALTRAKSQRVSGSSSRDSLPDLTAWVARSPKLSSEASRSLYSESRESTAPRSVSTRSRQGSTPSRSARAPSAVDSGRSMSGRASSFSPEQRRVWTRDPGEWSRRQTIARPERAPSARAPAPRERVSAETRTSIGAGSHGRDRSTFDRSGSGRVSGGRSSARDWRGLASVKPPGGLSGSSTRTPPVRKVVDGMKALRYQGRPGVSRQAPRGPTSVGGAAGPRGAGGVSRGRVSSGSAKGSSSVRSGGGGKGSSRGSSRSSSSRSSRGSGNGGG